MQPQLIALQALLREPGLSYCPGPAQTPITTGAKKSCRQRLECPEHQGGGWKCRTPRTPTKLYGKCPHSCCGTLFSKGPQQLQATIRQPSNCTQCCSVLGIFAGLHLVLVGIKQVWTDLLYALGQARQTHHLLGKFVVRFVVHLQDIILLLDFLDKLCVLSSHISLVYLKLLDSSLGLCQR